MASVLSHPAVALGLGPVFRRLGIAPRFWAVGAACTVVPDVDALGFGLRIPYESLLGHRGLTHSLAFAAALAGALTFVSWREHPSRAVLFTYLFLCAASHSMLDAMTDGGLGVAFLSPFTNARFFLPWRKIHVSPIGIFEFFEPRVLAILRSELVWIWLPSAALAALGAVTGWIPRRSD